MVQEGQKKPSYRCTSLLVSLVLLLFTSYFTGESIVMRGIRATLAILVLFGAVVTTSRFGSARLISIGLGLPAILAYIAMLSSPSEGYFLLHTILMVAFFGHLMALLCWEVFREQEVTGDTLAGALSIYLLFGITFSFIYAIIAFYDAGAFPVIYQAVHEQTSSATDSVSAIRSALRYGFSSFLYFSFTTLTTLGYGDITPAVPLARNVAILEAVFGQFYLAVLVARLVALNLQRSVKG